MVMVENDYDVVMLTAFGGQYKSQSTHAKISFIR
jgi:hypothetical protein